MLSSAKVFFAAATLALLSLSAPASLVVNRQILADGVTSQYPGIGSATYSAAGGVATTSAGTHPQPMVESTVTGGDRLRASSLMSYSFHLEGPTGITVPVLVNGYYEYLARGSSGAGHSLTLYNGSVSLSTALGFFRESIYSYISPTYGTDDFVFHSIDRFANGQYYSSETGIRNQALFSGPIRIGANVTSFQTLVLELDTFATSYADANGITGNARSLLDPVIFIDPSFADRNLFSIVMDDPVPNVGLTPVPEPATYGMAAALLLTGIIVLRCHRIRGETADPARA